MISRCNRLIAGIAIAWLATACSTDPNARDHRTSLFPSCAGTFCFSGKLMTEEELVAQYGVGYSEDGRFPYHCYEAQSGGPFVRLRSAAGKPAEVLDILVSDRLSCPSAKPPAKPFGKLATDGGLNLGDSRDRVVELYGEPERESVADDLEIIRGAGSRDDRQPLGDTQLFYYARDPETLHAIVFLRNGIVSAILISRFP